MMDEEQQKRLADEEELRRNETDVVYVFRWIIVVIILVLVMAWMLTPSVLKSAKKMEMTQAISNSKQVYLVLMDFEADFGNFPDDHTAAKDARLTSFRGKFSNDYLGQLIAGGYTKSEEIFYAFDKRFKDKKPDDAISPTSRILEKNECGFSYVLVDDKGRRRGLSTSDYSEYPILLAPLVNEWGSFDEKSYQGSGVYLRVDGSARNDRLRNPHQKIKLKTGETFLESGPKTMWKDLKPHVLLPER